MKPTLLPDTLKLTLPDGVTGFLKHEGAASEIRRLERRYGLKLDSWNASNQLDAYHRAWLVIATHQANTLRKCCAAPATDGISQDDMKDIAKLAAIGDKIRKERNRHHTRVLLQAEGGKKRLSFRVPPAFSYDWLSLEHTNASLREATGATAKTVAKYLSGSRCVRKDSIGQKFYATNTALRVLHRWLNSIGKKRGRREEYAQRIWDDRAFPLIADNGLKDRLRPLAKVLSAAGANCAFPAASRPLAQ